MTDLRTPLRFLEGTGPARAARLANLGLETLGDLLEHYPRAYLDRSHVTPLGELRPGAQVTSVGCVRSLSLRRTRRGMRNVHVILEDPTGVAECVWFNQPYLQRVMRRGSRLLVSGQVELYRRLQFKNPEYELLPATEGEDDERDADAGGIVPVYPLTAGVSQKVMRRLVGRVLDELGALPEFMPAELVARHGLTAWDVAHREIHRPTSLARAEEARRRIAYQELFDLQLLLAISRRVHQRPRTAWPLAPEGRLVDRLLAGLPFALTAAQTRAIDVVRRDLARDRPMHRLLEGDVGSGKTLVAIVAALLAVEAGAQVAFMAPTEILAGQHARTLARWCAPLGVVTETFLGGQPAREVRALRSALAAGGIQIALGTHALIQEGVIFHSLGLVIVDEQHRFGVLQRAHLLGKGRTPHALVMSATPIPRTLALTLFGDLDLTVIDEKPPGRVAPKTHLLPEGRYAAMLDYIAGELDRGAQAYFVCPLVEASEELDLKAATELHERLRHEERLAGHCGGLLHGRMKSEEKDRVMRGFAAGEFRYLVSTTVIEVGVDVPNASLMVIEHPERFGLSQLHQLRGRVGRGRQPAHVFLVRRKGIGPDAARRLAVMMGESDGFKIAEEDLRQRGPGDFFGVRQSGLPPLKVADPIGDPGLLETARRDAFDLVAAEGLAALAAGPLWRRLEMRFGDRMKLYAVG